MAIGVPMLNKEKLNQSKVLQLVDWQFNRYLSMQLLPLLYLLMIIGAVLLVGFLWPPVFPVRYGWGWPPPPCRR